jgi:hypothetical protein
MANYDGKEQDASHYMAVDLFHARRMPGIEPARLGVAKKLLRMAVTALAAKAPEINLSECVSSSWSALH